MEPTQLQWLNYRHVYVLDKTPEKRDLLELLSEVQDRWRSIGEVLGVNNAYLKGLQHNGLPNSEKLSDTLQYWIDSVSSPVTWGTIVKVLHTEYINLPRVANKIQDKLSTQLYNKYCHRQSNHYIIMHGDTYIAMLLQVPQLNHFSKLLYIELALLLLLVLEKRK